MTAGDRRKEALRFMHDTMSFRWTPNVDTVHTNTMSNGNTSSKDLKVGQVYGGTPYVSNCQGNLYTVMEYYDGATGILDLTGTLVG